MSFWWSTPPQWFPWGFLSTYYVLDSLGAITFNPEPCEGGVLLSKARIQVSEWRCYSLRLFASKWWENWDPKASDAQYWFVGISFISWGFSSVQLLSCVWLFVTPWAVARQASLSITSSQSLLKPMSIASVIPSNHLLLCRPLLLLPSVFTSIRVFSKESVLRIRWPKYWSFSFSSSPPNEYSGLISFRMDWLDLLADQGTFKSLLQHHSSKASVLQHSVFFIVQLSHS